MPFFKQMLSYSISAVRHIPPLKALLSGTVQEMCWCMIQSQLNTIYHSRGKAKLNLTACEIS